MMPNYGKIKPAECIFIIEYIFLCQKKKEMYTDKMGKANKLCGY